MYELVFILIATSAIMFAVIGSLSLLAHYYPLGGIKRRHRGRRSSKAALLNQLVLPHNDKIRLRLIP